MKRPEFSHFVNLIINFSSDRLWSSGRRRSQNACTDVSRATRLRRLSSDHGVEEQNCTSNVSIAVVISATVALLLWVQNQKVRLG